MSSQNNKPMNNSQQDNEQPREHTNEAFEAALKSKLEAFSLEMTPAERERLDAARRTAVARAGERATAGGPSWSSTGARRWQFGASLAAVALMAVLVLPGQQGSDIDALPVLDEASFAAAAELELLEELELLAWLDEQDLADAG